VIIIYFNKLLECARLRVNIDKTEAIWLGSKRSAINSSFQINMTVIACKLKTRYVVWSYQFTTGLVNVLKVPRFETPALWIFACRKIM
jgi:hypothetical protein